MDHAFWCGKPQPLPANAPAGTAITYDWFDLSKDVDKVTLNELNAHVQRIKDESKDATGNPTPTLHAVRNELAAGQFLLNSLGPEL